MAGVLNWVVSLVFICVNWWPWCTVVKQPAFATVLLRCRTACTSSQMLSEPQPSTLGATGLHKVQPPPAGPALSPDTDTALPHASLCACACQNCCAGLTSMHTFKQCWHSWLLPQCVSLAACHMSLADSAEGFPKGVGGSYDAGLGVGKGKVSRDTYAVAGGVQTPPPISQQQQQLVHTHTCWSNTLLLEY